MKKYSWKRPTLEEIKEAVDKLGGDIKTGKLIGVERNAVYCWRSGKRNMKKSSWILLKNLAKVK